MPSTLQDPKLEGLLDRLHAASAAQEDEINAYFRKRVSDGNLAPNQRFDEDLHRFVSDKMVALDREKAELCYLLCRSLRAERVVEAGTSYGVSTLYLAAAMRDNGGGTVIATEYEPAKAERARAHFAEARLSEWIELREGDLRETLREIPGAVDFALIDIWDVAFDALRLVSPHLRTGGVVIADNTTAFRDSYAEYFAFLNDPENRFRTQTLPFPGGLELSVRI